MCGFSVCFSQKADWGWFRWANLHHRFSDRWTHRTIYAPYTLIHRESVSWCCWALKTTIICGSQSLLYIPNKAYNNFGWTSKPFRDTIYIESCTAHCIFLYGSRYKPSSTPRWVFGVCMFPGILAWWDLYCGFLHIQWRAH